MVKKPGDIFETGAGNLKANKIFHAVTVKFPGGNAKVSTIEKLVKIVYEVNGGRNLYWLLNKVKGHRICIEDDDNSSQDIYSDIAKELGFKARKDLSTEWAGKRDAEFNELAGITDGIFCHPGKFIAGAKSLESIKILANKAVNNK